MLNLTIKEAELVRGLCAKGRVSVSDSDLVKVASLLPRQMLKEAAPRVKVDSKIVKNMRKAVQDISNLVAPETRTMSAKDLVNLRKANEQAALAQQPSGIINKFKRWWAGGLTSAENEAVNRATDLQMNYADYMKKQNRYNQLHNKGLLDENSYNEYGRLARELGYHKGSVGNTPISQNTFNTFDKATNQLESAIGGAQNLRSERDALAKKVKRLENLNRDLESRRLREVREVTEKGRRDMENLTNSYNAAKQNEETQRLIQDQQRRLNEYENRRWYQDPAAAASLGVGGTLAGIGGLNAMGNITGSVFGNRGYDDRRGRGPVIIS